MVGTDDPLHEAGVPVDLHEFPMTHTAATEPVCQASLDVVVAGAGRGL
ncbi:hypothetical protein ACFXJ8_15365 [Nonomuraea sp. NPDC059194]